MGLAAQPPTAVPAITIDGDAGPGEPRYGASCGQVCRPARASHIHPHEHRIFKGARRKLPQERPEKWARAIIDAWKMAKS
jgi:hypothetical protein